MPGTDELAGVFDVIDTERTAHDPVNPEVSEPQAEGGQTQDEGEQKQKTDETEDKDTGEAKSEPQQTKTDESTETKKETSEESKDSKDETSKTETKSAEDFSNWRDTLPPPPAEFQGKTPEFNEEGAIVNMTPQEYSDYLAANAAHSYRKEAYTNNVEVRAFQVAEEIIPEIKDNPAIRQLIQNTRIASHLSGQPIDTVQAALQVRDALGLAPERLQAAKAEGAQNAKASITVQKNAALESGSSRVKSDDGDKIVKLQRRVRSGDDAAFVEILDIWQDKGII